MKRFNIPSYLVRNAGMGYAFIDEVRDWIAENIPGGVNVGYEYTREEDEVYETHHTFVWFFAYFPRDEDYIFFKLRWVG